MKNKESGTGLGLSMAYSIINQIGGFIDFESEVNRGSSFRICIPELKGIPVEIESVKSNRQLVKGSGTILVVDDEKPLLAVAEETLVSCGYTVLKASDGVEGISIYRENMDRIDAVLLDISMPFMSGFEVFGKLKELNNSVRVLLSSGFNDDERISSAISNGAAGFLQKPYTAIELSQRINEVLQQKV